MKSYCNKQQKNSHNGAGNKLERMIVELLMVAHISNLVKFRKLQRLRLCMNTTSLQTRLLCSLNKASLRCN